MGENMNTHLQKHTGTGCINFENLGGQSHFPMQNCLFIMQFINNTVHSMPFVWTKNIVLAHIVHQKTISNFAVFFQK